MSNHPMPVYVEYGTKPATLTLTYATPVERDVAFQKFRNIANQNMTTVNDA